jgi:hypothetical protein
MHTTIFFYCGHWCRLWRFFNIHSNSYWFVVVNLRCYAIFSRSPSSSCSSWTMNDDGKRILGNNILKDTMLDDNYLSSLIFPCFFSSTMCFLLAFLSIAIHIRFSNELSIFIL